MTELGDIIRQEISVCGPISFARFMELALYEPTFGYYERQAKQIGCQGDFYTSVSTGPVFGELLAFQFADWLQELGSRVTSPHSTADEVPAAPHSPAHSLESHFQIVEAGAHDGRLAHDILSWMNTHRTAFPQQIEYVIVEPSPARQGMQRKMLSKFTCQIRWVPALDKIPATSVTGVIFGNELLDAMPVHRIGWNSRENCWFEWRVTFVDGGFRWVRMEASSEAKSSASTYHDPTLPTELTSVLPDGFTTEVCPSASTWWKRAAQKLQNGKLLALDYGLTHYEFFNPSRSNGTLRAYGHHHVLSNVLDDPGAVDITAHVNFTAVENAGVSAGLVTIFSDSQAGFLTGIFKRTIDDPDRFTPWTPDRLRQFKTLTHPEHLGRSFKVLAQATHQYSDRRISSGG
ncbi:MAG: hypothetical protein EXS31_19060 [Pedosphaera sp.]|nr:hypothetical protein [Pedosphaera sp.]